MARGWESKSVESQIEDRESRQTKGREMSREEIDLQRKRESLESSRRGILSELASASSPLRRSSLEQALKHLESELSKL
jgi:hypothetical protein